jgi:hypothetical protein
MGGLGVTRISLDATISPSPDVVGRMVGGELVLLDLESATYFGLNEVGSRMWTLMGELGSLRQVCDAVSREYNVPRVQLERDLLALAHELHGKGLLHITGAKR